jgi:hypothetical protein
MRREMNMGFWLGNLKEEDIREDVGVGGRMILKWFFKK